MTSDRVYVATYDGADDRKILNIGSEDLGLQLVAEDQLYVRAFDEHCGNTETGFGAEVGCALGVADARALRDFLDAWLKGKGATS